MLESISMVQGLRQAVGKKCQQRLILGFWPVRAGLTIWGPHNNARRGPLSHTRSQDFLWRCTFTPKKLTTFLVVVVTFKPTLNVQTSKQRGNNFAVDPGVGWRRGPLPWYNRHIG